jgi:ribose transport system substrate-binding protein
MFVLRRAAARLYKARRLWLFALPVALVIGAAVTGCGSSTNDGSSSGSSTGGNSGTEASGKEVMLGFVQMDSEPYPNQVAAGIEAAAKKYGAEVTVTGPDTLNPSQTVTDFQNLLSTGVDGVLLQQTAPELFVRPIETAVEQGVPVNTITNPAPEGGTNFTIGEPFHGIGAGIGATFSEKLGPDASGTVYVGVCAPGIVAIEAVIEGFENELAKGSPNVSVEEVATAAAPSENYAAWQRIVAQHPEALGYYGICDQDVTSLIKVKQQNPDSKWLSGSEGGENPLTAPAIQRGELTAAIFQRGFVQGYVAAALMLEHLINGKPEPEGWVNTGYDVITAQNAKEIETVAASTSAATSYYEGLINKLIAEPSAKQPQEAQVTEANPINLDPDGRPVAK